MLTMIRTDLPRAEFLNELMSHTSTEDDLYDHFSCPNHPGFKLQVLCPKEDFHPSLLCIKCLIDPDIERRIKGEPLIAIQDVISKGTSTPPRESVSQLSRNALRERIIEFSSKDYLGIFEDHTDTQMKKLQREVEKVKESLDTLQYQFKQLFDKQHKHLKDKEEELKMRINEYVEEQEQMENLYYSTSEEVMNVIRKTSSVKEFERIIKTLYHRGSPNQKVITGAMMNRIYEIMNDLKEKVNKMKNCKIHTTILEEMRHKIDSVEILDQSLQTAPTNVNSKLMQTLEKIRVAEEKKKSPMKDSGYMSIDRLSQRRAEFLDPLKERLNYFTSSAKKYNKRMEIEPTVTFETDHKSYKMNDRDSAYHSGYKSQHGPRTAEKEQRTQRRGQESATQTINMVNAYTNTDFEDDYYYQPRYEEDQPHRRQKTEASSYRRVDDRRRREHEMTHDEYEDNYESRNYSADYHMPEEYGTDNSVEPQPRVSSIKNKTHSSSTKNKMKKESSVRKSPKKPSDEEHNTSQKDTSLDKWIKKDQKKKQRESEHERKEKESSRKKHTETEAEEDGRGSETDNSTPRRARVKDLHDWINRRVTGYLIFQNTIHATGLEKEHQSDHLNRIAGDKWKALTKAEREEYRSLAMNARVQLKREFRNVEIENPDIKDLQELLEKRIKKVKKEDSDDGNE